MGKAYQTAANLALQAGYAVPPVLAELVLMAGCFGFAALVMMNEFAALGDKGQPNESHPGS